MRVHVCVHLCITFMYLCKFGLFVWVCVKGWQGFPVTSSDTKLLSPYIDHATVKSLPLTLPLHSMRGRGPLEREHCRISLPMSSHDLQNKH